MKSADKLFRMSEIADLSILSAKLIPDFSLLKSDKEIAKRPRGVFIAL